MRKTFKVLWSAVFVMMLVAGSVTLVFGTKSPARTINLPDDGTNTVDDDADVPDATARVARISFIRGDVQILRGGETDWEKATLNLPIVEGDQLVTSGGARLEIQFNNFSHLRLDENGSMTMAVLRPEGIAVSLSLGTMSMRVTDLEKSAGYIEVDAPKTTLSLLKAGTYRIDAGKAGDTDIQLSVTNGGEGRVYSDTAGFTLKSGRGARVFIDGSNAGEWETADAARNSDEFDSWASDRDVVIAKRIKDAYYNQYYDQDIYGADDLNGYGEWVHSSQYGYVWRPFQSAIDPYSDWSPYRYGHWRWVPPYGWTWVNDEPWGWATYHYGRWVFDNGYWVWTPYGYYRPSHSWWFPALVSITIINDNVCWYPLQYHHRYSSFNGHRDRDHNRGRGGIRPTPTPTGIGKGPGRPVGGSLGGDPSTDRMPPKGVIAVNAKDFGTRTHGYKTAPADVAGEIITKVRDKDENLPDHGQVSRRITKEIAADAPKAGGITKQIPVGAASRKPDAPLDRELHDKRMFGDRSPAKTNNGNGGITADENTPREPRKVGAVDRPPVKPADGGDTGISNRPSAKPKSDPPTTPPTGFQPAPREFKPPKETPQPPPGYDPSPKQVREPKEGMPARPPKNDPPAREEKPKTEAPPRVEPPQREAKPPSEAPKAQPKTEAPKPEPKTDAPKAQPKTDTPPKVDKPEQKNRKDTIN